jgi:tetratricopeptide (TPR) repeat protein
MMARLVLQIGLVLLLAAMASAGSGDAGRETSFSLGAGARSLGMGGAFTPLADDASAVYYNPSWLAHLDYQQLSFMRATLFEGTSYGFASWVIPVSEKDGIGIGFMRVGTDDIVRREDFDSTGTFDYVHSQVIFSYGRELFHGISSGVSFKVVNQSLDNYSDYAYGADISLSAAIHKRLSLGLIARDILAPKIQLDSLSETTPWSVAGGVAVKNIAVSDHSHLTASLDLEKPEDRSFKVHTGAEMVFEGTYALRFGYDRDNISFGAGLMFKRLQLDYAYKLLDYIENSHRFSLTLMIGPSASERAYVAQPVQPREPVLDERQLMVLQLKDRGDGFFHQFQFDSALVYYSQALEFEPGHPEILNTIAAIEKARQTDLEQQERLRTAEEELRQFIRRYYDQASRFYDRKYYPAALDLLELILEIDSDHENAITLKQEIEAAKTADISLLIEQARTAEQQGKIVEAIEAYNRILDLDAGNDEIQLARQRALASLDLSQQLSLGINLFTQGRYEEARLRFNSVLRVNGEDPVALEYLGKIESAQAEASTLEALQRDRHFWNLYLDGIRHMRNNDYQKAIEAWEQVLQAYPNNVNTLNNLEQARLRLQSEQTR